MTQISIRVDAGQAKAVLKIEDGARSTTIVLETSAVDKLLQGLGRARADMAPPIQSEAPLLAKVTGIPNPAFKVDTEVMQGHALLQLRDPRFGWLHFGFAPARAREIAEALQARAAAVLQMRPGRKPN